MSRRAAVAQGATAVLAALALLAAGALTGCATAGPAPASGADPTAGWQPDQPATIPSLAVPDGAAPAAPVVAFYGDSYTLGTGASREENRWSTVICRERGWTEVNPSVNGLGFVNNRGSLDIPPAIVAIHPDTLFVTMGLNDNFTYPYAPDEVHAAIERDLQLLRDGLPDTRIVVVEPFWYTDERPDSVEVIIGWVHDEADAIDADWIPGASHWIEGHPEWMAADGLHPNDDGYAAMAEQMDAGLAALGL